MLPSFDELMNLALHEPEKLETLRQSWVEDTISSAPEYFQRRLRGLQFQIDMEREKASNPVSSCVRISQMMHEGLASLHDAINKPAQDKDLQQEHQGSSASILSFPLAILD
jgi:hypothetical protein